MIRVDSVMQWHASINTTFGGSLSILDLAYKVGSTLDVACLAVSHKLEEGVLYAKAARSRWFC